MGEPRRRDLGARAKGGDRRIRDRRDGLRAENLGPQSRFVLARRSKPGISSRPLDQVLSTDLPPIRREYLIPVLHTNACGDFTMMARENWFTLRGYPEWPIFSWFIDSVSFHQAYYNGLAVERTRRQLRSLSHRARLRFWMDSRGWSQHVEAAGGSASGPLYWFTRVVSVSEFCAVTGAALRRRYRPPSRPAGVRSRSSRRTLTKQDHWLSATIRAWA